VTFVFRQVVCCLNVVVKQYHTPSSATVRLCVLQTAVHSSTMLWPNDSEIHTRSTRRHAANPGYL